MSQSASGDRLAHVYRLPSSQLCLALLDLHPETLDQLSGKPGTGTCQGLHTLFAMARKNLARYAPVDLPQDLKAAVAASTAALTSSCGGGGDAADHSLGGGVDVVKAAPLDGRHPLAIDEQLPPEPIQLR